MYDVLVWSEKSKTFVTYALDQTKREAKALVKMLRGKNKKAHFVSAREDILGDADSEIIFGDEEGKQGRAHDADSENDSEFSGRDTFSAKEFSRQSPYKSLGLLERETK